MHSVSRSPPGEEGEQNLATSRLHASIIATYWAEAEDTESSTNNTSAKHDLLTWHLASPSWIASVAPMAGLPGFPFAGNSQDHRLVTTLRQCLRMLRKVIRTAKLVAPAIPKDGLGVDRPAGNTGSDTFRRIAISCRPSATLLGRPCSAPFGFTPISWRPRWQSRIFRGERRRASHCNASSRYLNVR
jgi:hypothetical protein